METAAESHSPFGSVVYSLVFQSENDDIKILNYLILKTKNKSKIANTLRNLRCSRDIIRNENSLKYTKLPLEDGTNVLIPRFAVF